MTGGEKIHQADSGADLQNEGTFENFLRDL